ncbi:WD repeat and FYVE domain-containing protein [Pseudomassariella vexata]|uniref:Beige protein homolog 1 n=1 Tax=Pseudomassariella vexata TaxID=1141098 RepID=A0A1Y2D7P4_9PEZI|nr:WD repeat and FYVE domain-containing protein [Pseudomassariella vexata]ORY55300.1 WD repeat and FYVE domain-containing protein [Pseudomassariella vexata]
MSSRPSRYRSSTSASTPLASSKAVEVLQRLLDTISAIVAPHTRYEYPAVDELLPQISRVQQHLAAPAPPSSVQDDFRHLRGFQRIFDILRAFSGFYNPPKRTEQEKKGLFCLLDAVLSLLSAAFVAHPGNRRYFRTRVEGGGWEALEQTIASIGLGGSELDFWTSGQLFGKLLSFSLNDRALDDLCCAMSSRENLQPQNGSANPTTGQVSTTSEDGKETKDITMQIDQAVKKVVGPKTIVQSPEVVRTIVDFWTSMPRDGQRPENPVSILVLKVISSVIDTSYFNLCQVHDTGILSRLLQLAFTDDSGLSKTEHEVVLDICKSLMSLGFNKLMDAQSLLINPLPSSAEFCLDMVEKHQSPPFIQFDLFLHGHASIDLPSIGRSFPPQSTGGYTFTTWLRVDRFDPKSHTTIFGLCDSTQTCFLLTYLEKDTHNFILQTSVTSQRPSVRFKSYAFKENKWYHIALVHRRPKTMTASKASLYVNGEFVEQIRASYPVSPPLSNGSTESFASFTSNSNKTVPVQAFLGTPRELSINIGPGLIYSKMSLASAHLFEDVINDDLLAVPSRLGPRYQGNFQDCLGGFQTYEASAALGLRNDVVGTGRDGSSDIIKVIRDKAAHLLPEQRLILSFMPSSVFREKDPLGDSQLFRALSRGPANTLVQLTLKNGTGIAINTALPSVNDALLRSSGVAVMSGEPILAVPQYFDDALWRLAGFTPLALKIIERASTPEGLLCAVQMVFRCTNSSWRNSESMERDGGYAILGILLRAKLGFNMPGAEALTERLVLESTERENLTFELLSLVLEFVGYKHLDPIESVIINPLAYRILLIDFDAWRKCGPVIQELYYKQFVTFAVMSKYHQYNNRRLLRMRIVKRLLDALKAESLPENVLRFFITALETLVKCSYNTEVHRSLALFITYALHANPNSLPRTPRPASSLGRNRTLSIPRRPAVETNVAGPKVPQILTKKQVGTKILEMYSQLLCEKGNLTIIRKFARTVTNKVLDAQLPAHNSKLTMAQWLLHLLTEDDPEIVIYGCKILARLLVAHGSSYTGKFAGKTGGFSIMAHRLKRWWDIPTIWPLCFSILFGYDIAEIDFEKSFDFFSLIETFGKSKITHPDALLIITSMLQHGLKDVLKNAEDPNSPSGDRDFSRSIDERLQSSMPPRSRQRSMSLMKELESRQANQSGQEKVAGNAAILQTVVRFLSDLHCRSADFRDFTLSSEYVRLLLSGLYPVLVSTAAVSPETELNSRDSALTFEGGDVIIRPIAGTSTPAPVIRTSGATDTTLPNPMKTSRGTPLRKASSFQLLTSQNSPQPSVERLGHVMNPKKSVASQSIGNTALEGILELVINVFMDQILHRKEFPGFGLFLKVPPGFQEHQAYFESYVLQRTINHLSTTIKLDWKLLSEPRVLTNMARFSLHIVEAIFEGWFMNGTESMLDFAGLLLEYLNKPEVSKLKSVRLCSQAISTIRNSFLKLVMLRLSEMDDPKTTELEANFSMEKILYWQMVVLDSLSLEDDYMKLLCYQLYLKLVDYRANVRLAAVNIWRIMLVQKPEECSTLFRQFVTPDQSQLIQGFKKVTEIDTDTFIDWVDEHQSSLDGMFFGGISRTWEEFAVLENHKTTETAKSRLAKRRETLKRWQSEIIERETVILRHDMANYAWMKSIYGSEHFKHQRLMQDQQDDVIYFTSRLSSMERDLTRPGAVFYKPGPMKWKLDRTEGRNRMRLRLLPDFARQNEEFQPKRKANDTQSASSLRLNTTATPQSSVPSIGTTPSSALADSQSGTDVSKDTGGALADSQSGNDASDQSVVPDDDFEMVDDPNDPVEGEDGFEDKNRRVMRRLEQGDAVQQVYNISRIVGLEACEGILLVGKDALYIMDNFFQCADGEIVNVWEAPAEDRDPFSQIITGQKAAEKRQNSNRSAQESRSWRWHDVISISKRRFLFRDVAIEIFFTDGRSYLLTAINVATRDEVYTRLMGKTPHTAGANSLPNPEDAWRLESLKVFEESSQGLGAKFGSIFNSTQWNPAMRRWQKGEISNFHYLMLVNTMAGRTFNDLTQYPVFPWILADYTSEELNLDDPATFRDLSKPMGAQTPSRQADYMARYNSLAEIGEQPFHYGTHYSSAMQVASYLIRLPPFVQSYILLQGGTFDHADRLFFSIAGSWNSASKDNGSDVRELIPEFFYLPDFLTNINGYDFGDRQGSGGKVNNVELPPWAKGDPRIFIAKHREALESPYVSQHLHLWIDLVFGHKQRGEAAVENLNVFHYLSYHGAKDLDNITDAHERSATTSIIHNFGQTPHQVFARPHPPRENVRFPAKRLDTSSHALARIPHPLLDSHERVSSLIYSPKLDRLLCSSPFRLNLPPFFDKYLEWGFADNSIRFFFTENRKTAGVSENLHFGQISCIVVADSKTLITAGEDCVVSVHGIQSSSGKPVELLQRSSLFAHKTPVTTIAVSKAFSTFVTVSADGHAFLWDLNRLEFVRKLPSTRSVECARINDVSGEIMLCSGPNVMLYSLNGDLLVDQNVCGEHDDFVHACAFYEGSGNEWLENYLVFTGHKRGRVNIWKRVVKNGKWALEFLRRLDHIDSRSETGANTEAAITCITPMPQLVYTGDDDGRVYEWSLIQRER